MKYKTDSQLRIALLYDIPMSMLSYQPFLSAWVETLRLYGKEDSAIKRELQPSYQFLKEFYNNYRPDSVGQYLRLSSFDVDNEYFNSAPLYTVMPWQKVSPESFFNHSQKMMGVEYEENSKDKYKNEYGQKRYGPVADKLLDAEYSRLVNVYDSIKENGLDKNFTTRGYVLLSGNEYRYITLGGLHRTAALCALKHEILTVEISLIDSVMVNRSEYSEWHHVKSGLYNEQQALEVFDNYFKTMNS